MVQAAPHHRRCPCLSALWRLPVSLRWPRFGAGGCFLRYAPPRRGWLAGRKRQLLRAAALTVARFRGPPNAPLGCASAPKITQPAPRGCKRNRKPKPQNLYKADEISFCYFGTRTFLSKLLTYIASRVGNVQQGRQKPNKADEISFCCF